MKAIADTNLLVRLIAADDAEQEALAAQAFEAAELVAVPVVVLCELAWVLRRAYGHSAVDVAKAIRQIAGTRKIVVDRPAVEAGLATLEAGGDFADGVVAHQGRWLGGEILLSFDRKAVKLLNDAGISAELLG